MVGHGTKFGRKKEQAIAALLSHRSIEEAARAADIGFNTLLRWLKEPEFDAAYRNARQAAFGQCIARLQHASSAAVSAVLKIMVDQNAPASARLRAADIVLARSAKAIELEHVEARVSELERAARKRRSEPHEDRARGEVSNLIGRLRKVKGQSTDIVGCRPDLKIGTEHGLALAGVAKKEKP
jgi:hypothetical protein